MRLRRRRSDLGVDCDGTLNIKGLNPIGLPRSCLLSGGRGGFGRIVAFVYSGRSYGSR